MVATFAEPFIANTDRAWFDYLSGRSVAGVVDEVNFWLPKATSPMKAMSPGEPIFFRLKKPDYAIAGYGFFAHFGVLDLDMAWSVFGWKNGDPNKVRFLERIGGYRGLNLFDPSRPRMPIGCTTLRDATFWPEDQWIPWGDAEGWPKNVVQGKTERDARRAARLLEAIARDNRRVPDDFEEGFKPLEVDERAFAERVVLQREGQGAFRLRVLDSYGGQCAITGEHTVPVLDAAHIQPYLGPRSNHVQNGLLLTREFHALYDAGYVGVTPDYEVRISDRLRSDWHNGRRYYPYNNKALVKIPSPGERPSPAALAWHMEHVFKAA